MRYYYMTMVLKPGKYPLIDLFTLYHGYGVLSMVDSKTLIKYSDWVVVGQLRFTSKHNRDLLVEVFDKDGIDYKLEVNDDYYLVTIGE